MIRPSILLIIGLCCALGGSEEPTPRRSLDEYSAIPRRNAFALRPATGSPPLELRSSVPVSQKPALRLNGLAKIGGERWALLVQEERGRPPLYWNLREGERTPSFQVAEVDLEHEEVRLTIEHADVIVSFRGQEADEKERKEVERQFVAEHTRAHEELQRRERERLARAD